MTLIPPKARYQQIADQIRDQIERGNYSAGDPIPTEAQLVEIYSLSRGTIRQAINVLRAEGLVEARHGKGTFVSRRRPILIVSASYTNRDQHGEYGKWSSELAGQGIQATQKLRKVATVPAPLEVANRLHLEEGIEVVVRQRLMFADQEPVELADSWYPCSIGAGTELARSAKIPGGTNAALERLGISIAEFVEEIHARMPSPEERQILKLDDGIPVVIYARTTLDCGQVPVEYCKMILRADQHILRYRIPIHDSP